MFPWKDLDTDMQEQILRKTALRFVFNQRFERRVPLELRPPLSYAQDTSYADTIQSLVIQRSRSNIEGHCPNDTLTVSFSDCVDRGRASYLNYRTLWEVGYDKNMQCEFRRILSSFLCGAGTEMVHGRARAPSREFRRGT